MQLLNEPSPTLKGRFLNLQRQARKMKQTISHNEIQVKHIVDSIQEGTESTILSDKIAFIRDLLNEKLQRINYKIKKHINQQKQRNNQLVEMIAIIKNQKLRLQEQLSALQQRIQIIALKIGLNEKEI